MTGRDAHAATAPLRVGVIGCGVVSGTYLGNRHLFESFEIVACADLDASRAEARAAEFAIPRACSVDELLNDPNVDAVLNLTVPTAHASVSLAALEAGKHVFVEKPLAVSLADGRRILEVAKERGLRVGVAPDTFLGAGLQTCRALLDQMRIGAPVAASAFMLGHGHESWHPDPAFFYQVGGGPLLDMGPYYVTALVVLLGPVQRVTAASRITFPERRITSEPRRGQVIRVEVPTHIAGVLEFASGAIASLVTTFDVWGGTAPRLEIYGTTGTLLAPDPQAFGGPVFLLEPSTRRWTEVGLSHGFADNSRGLGLSDMARALGTGRPHRASGELGLHVLEIMHGLLLAAQEGRHYTLASTCGLPEALPVGFGLKRPADRFNSS